MLGDLLYVQSSLISKIMQCKDSTEGILGLLGCLVFNYIVGYEGMMLFMIVCVVTDGIFGIISATKRGVYTTSALMRHTIVKVGVYCVVILLLIGMEKIFDITSTVPVAVVVAMISFSEIWSILASSLIINPNIPILRLLQNALVGEISSKLCIEKEDVKEVLENGNYLKSYKDGDQETANNKYDTKKVKKDIATKIKKNRANKNN